MGAVVFLHECELEDILSDLQQLHRHTKRVQREKTLGKNLCYCKLHCYTVATVTASYELSQKIAKSGKT